MKHLDNVQDGTVKWFQDARGYGFILGDDDREYFVHYSQIHTDAPGGFRTLQREERVRFVPATTGKGLAAHDVRRILHYDGVGL